MPFSIRGGVLYFCTAWAWNSEASPMASSLRWIQSSARYGISEATRRSGRFGATARRKSSVVASAGSAVMPTSWTSPRFRVMTRSSWMSTPYSSFISSVRSWIQSSPAMATSSSPISSCDPNSCGRPSQPKSTLMVVNRVGPPLSKPDVLNPAAASRSMRLPPRETLASEPAGMPILSWGRSMNPFLASSFSGLRARPRARARRRGGCAGSSRTCTGARRAASRGRRPCPAA